MIRYSSALETSCPQFVCMCVCVCVNTRSCLVYVNPLNHITFYPHAVGPESMKYDVCIICLCVVLPHYRPATASAMTIVCLPIASYTSLSLFFGFCFFFLYSPTSTCCADEIHSGAWRTPRIIMKRTPRVRIEVPGP